ncbi:hypothetical protein QBC44DRAFT_235595 [Cladorrhinum sp. PSN332]|nr:hypothetical protein QBC44DRAFT_235595 [Cladorrhinum sp. PSN332]
MLCIPKTLWLQFYFHVFAIFFFFKPALTDNSLKPIRLYQAPVESDIEPKPSADKGPAQARSAIRRHRLGRRDDLRDQVRERRRRLLASASAYLGAEQQSANAALPAVRDPVPAPPGPDADPTDRTALLDLATRMGVVDERVSALFSDRWAHLHADSNPSRQENDGSQTARLRDRTRFVVYNRRTAGPGGEPYIVSSLRSTQVPDHPSRSSTTSPATTAPPFRRPTTTARAEASRRSEQTAGTESPRLDGLGDRNRSLSPEGDNVWDTLLTTLTPDPQPPSVGSSFASASASAAATQSTAAATQSTAIASSRTSFSIPETADHPYIFDPLCEFNSDTEEDHNDDDTRTFTATGARSSQRWADIARHRNNEDNIDERVMARIVGRISRREPIPDSWWAEVGITSSIGRDLQRQSSTNSE